MILGQSDVVDSAAGFLAGERFLRTVGVLAAAAILWLVVVRIGRRAVERLGAASPDSIERRQRLETMWRMGRRVIAVILVVIGAMTLMGVWGIPIGPFLAIGGAVGLAVGFGAQTVVKDVIAGFLIVSEGQFSIGDTVRIAGVTGVVEDIRLRVTVLRALEGEVHFVPNGSIDVTSNFTHEFSAVVADIGFGYGEDVDRVIGVVQSILDEFAGDPGWHQLILEPPQVLGVEELGDFAVSIRVRLLTSPPDRWSVRRELLRRVKVRFTTEGIEIPFPHRTLVPGDPAAWRRVLSGERA